MTGEYLSNRISKLSEHIEDLQVRCISDPANAAEVLSDALEELQLSVEELSAADEELIQQNEQLIEAQEALKVSKDTLKNLNEELERRVQERTADLIRINEELNVEIAERKLAEEAVKLERQRFNDVLETLPAYLVLLTPDYHVPFANRFFRERFGESHGRRCFEYLFGRSEPCEICETYSVLKTMKPHRWEWTGPDGRNYDIFDFPFTDTDGSTLIMEMGIDITERKQAQIELEKHRGHLEELVQESTHELEQALARIQAEIAQRLRKEEQLLKLNRTLKALSSSNQALMRATDESAYLQEVCNIIVEDCGHAMVWIGYAEEDEAKSIRPVANAGFEEGYLDTLKITWADTERGRGPTGTAIRTGKLCSCRNMLTDPKFEPWREQATKRGYASSIVIPLLSGDKAFGAINIYSRQPDPFSEDEVKLLSELSGDLAYGITLLRLRAAHARAEEEILQAKEEWERTFNTVPDLMAILDHQHRIVRVNKAMADRLSMTPQRCIGLACYEAIHGLSHPPEFCPHVLTCRDGEQHVTEVREPRLGGDFLVSTTPLHDSQGQLIGTVHVARDITERKHMEEELRESRDELEGRVAERTEELEVINEELRIEIDAHERTEKELIAAKEAAEESAEIKAAFMANMSHELRTPMNAVIGYTSLLLEENLNPEQRDYIEGIRNGGQALLALINDILDFSRVEKEKVELEHRPLSIRRCIDESLYMVAVQANQKSLNLAYTINYGTPDTIIGDYGRLRQILVNLLSNAVKFTDMGDVSVSVSSKAVVGSKRQILFTVRDTGIGIPQDKMNELFQPFGQVERIISRKRDGAGLGLAICKKLVELMGGEIWVESEEGRGSTFRFTIQAEAVPGKHQDLAETDRGAALESLAGQKPMAILVAEDNPSNQRVLLEMLKRMGYRADAVADGREVIQALERRPYELVFMDVKMPEMDGITAAMEIRKHWPNNGPKIVAITAYALEGDREKCLEAGMDDYISKPIQKKDLANILNRYQSTQVSQ